MAARRSWDLAQRLIEDTKQINEGLKQLNAQDPDSKEELPKEAKEAFLMREIQKEMRQSKNFPLAKRSFCPRLKLLRKKTSGMRRRPKTLDIPLRSWKHGYRLLKARTQNSSQGKIAHWSPEKYQLPTLIYRICLRNSRWHPKLMHGGCYPLYDGAKLWNNARDNILPWAGGSR